jgi:hypothetical protein
MYVPVGAYRMEATIFSANNFWIWLWTQGDGAASVCVCLCVLRSFIHELITHELGFV